MKGRSNIRCDVCNKKYSSKHVIMFKGMFICTECKLKRKNTTMHSKVLQMTSLKEAINKIYTVNVSSRKNGNYLTCYVYFPKILAGKKIKIKLIEK